MVAALTILDWVLLLVVLISVVRAAMKGFVRELAGFGSILLAFLFASWFYASAAVPFKDLVKSENIALFCGFSIVFVGTLIAGSLVGWLISRLIKAAKLQWFDRCLGALFGFCRGWLMGGILLLGLTAFNIQTEIVRDSELAPYFLPASRMIALVTPSEFKSRFQAGYASLERWWKHR